GGIMNNADTMSAVLGLLLGLATQRPPVVAATADAAPLGPVVAIDKAKAAAGAESGRARTHDEQAARVFSSSEGPSAPDTAGNAAPAAPDAAAPDAAVPSEGTVAAGQPTATIAAAQPDAATAADKYDPNSHRDPFRPPNVSSVVAETGAPRTPLEAYEIGQ